MKLPLPYELLHNIVEAEKLKRFAQQLPCTCSNHALQIEGCGCRRGHALRFHSMALQDAVDAAVVAYPEGVL